LGLDTNTRLGYVLLIGEIREKIILDQSERQMPILMRKQTSISFSQHTGNGKFKDILHLSCIHKFCMADATFNRIQQED